MGIILGHERPVSQFERAIGRTKELVHTLAHRSPVPRSLVLSLNTLFDARFTKSETTVPVEIEDRLHAIRFDNPFAADITVGSDTEPKAERWRTYTLSIGKIVEVETVKVSGINGLFIPEQILGVISLDQHGIRTKFAPEFPAGASKIARMQIGKHVIERFGIVVVAAKNNQIDKVTEAV